MLTSLFLALLGYLDRRSNVGSRVLHVLLGVHGAVSGNQVEQVIG